MSSPKAIAQQKLLPLTDPHHVREAFANELAGIQIRSDGTCHLTFAAIRPKHSMQGITHNDPDEERIVSARVVLPMAAMPGVMESFRQIQTAMAQHQAQQARAN